MKILVCGGRNYWDWESVYRVLWEIHETTKISLVIHGCATGADHWAFRWASFAAVEPKGFPADWKKYGKAAGPIRNQQMLDEGKPDLVVKFPGGKGTEDCVRRAEPAGVEVRRVV